ncbi:TPA: hypothetical protein I9Z90_002955 [Clostridium perfringens]|nr:hypothetical protein [Clostridium perfringens]
MRNISKKCFHLILDESFNERFFVVGGIVTTNDKIVEDAIFDVRKKIKANKNIKDRLKNKLLNEIKDHNLSGKYDYLKEYFFNKINMDSNTQFIGAYIDNCKMNVEDKYFVCLKKILEFLYEQNDNMNIKISYDNVTKIIYDEFEQKTLLEQKLNCLKEKYSIESIESKKSQEDKRIQGADLSVGSIRKILLEEAVNVNMDKYTILKAEITNVFEYN